MDGRSKHFCSCDSLCLMSTKVGIVKKAGIKFSIELYQGVRKPAVSISLLHMSAYFAFVLCSEYGPCNCLFGMVQAGEEEIKQLKEKLAATESGTLQEQQHIDSLARWANTHDHAMIPYFGCHKGMPKPN